MSKRCVEDSGLTTPPKLRRSNVITPSTMRGGHVYCVREKAIRSFTSTSLAHMVVETIARGTKSILLLLSMNAHGHVADYSGTLGSQSPHFSSSHKS